MIDHTSDKETSMGNKGSVKHPPVPLCGKIIKTYDNSRLPCLRPFGHEGGCNPFSDTPPLHEKSKG